MHFNSYVKVATEELLSIYLYRTLYFFLKIYFILGLQDMYSQNENSNSLKFTGAAARGVHSAPATARGQSGCTKVWLFIKMKYRKSMTLQIF